MPIIGGRGACSILGRLLPGGARDLRMAIFAAPDRPAAPDCSNDIFGELP